MSPSLKNLGVGGIACVCDWSADDDVQRGFQSVSVYAVPVVGKGGGGGVGKSWEGGMGGWGEGGGCGSLRSPTYARLASHLISSISGMFCLMYLRQGLVGLGRRGQQG